MGSVMEIAILFVGGLFLAGACAVLIAAPAMVLILAMALFSEWREKRATQKRVRDIERKLHGYE